MPKIKPNSLLIFARMIFSLLVVLLGIASADSALASQESDCYSLLLDRVADVPEGGEFVSLLPSNYEELDQDLFVSGESGEGPPIIKTDFQNPIFLKKQYWFGSELGFSSSRYNAIITLDIGSEDYIDVKPHLFDVEFAYDLDDDAFLWCQGIVREIKQDGLDPDDINTDIVSQFPSAQRIYGDVETAQKDGINYKSVIVDKDKMDTDYANPVYTMHMVMVLPESQRKDFNPYELVEPCVSITNSFYSEFIPKVMSEVVEPGYPKEILSDGTIKIEGYINDDGTRKKVYGVRPIEFNNQVINEYTYLPWLRYFVVSEMLQLGQSDVTNLWLSHASSEYLADLVSYYNGQVTLEESGLNADVRNNNIDEQIDNLVDMAVDIGAEEGAEEPNKTEEVQLFWRMKELFESGATDTEIQEYIADYPDYLDAMQEAYEALTETVKQALFSDIDADAWYAEYVEELVNDNVVAGYPDSTYRPGNSVNRAEIAKIVAELFDLTVPTSLTENPFPDVPLDAWYAPYVAAVKNAGAVGGYPDGNFRPSQAVNRAEAMKMILSASGETVSSADAEDADFSDVSGSDWFSNYVGFAKNRGIVGGYSDGSFKPGNQINRAEIAKIAALAKQTLRQQTQTQTKVSRPQ